MGESSVMKTYAGHTKRKKKKAITPLGGKKPVFKKKNKTGGYKHTTAGSL